MTSRISAKDAAAVVEQMRAKKKQQQSSDAAQKRKLNRAWATQRNALLTAALAGESFMSLEQQIVYPARLVASGFVVAEIGVVQERAVTVRIAALEEQISALINAASDCVDTFIDASLKKVGSSLPSKRSYYDAVHQIFQDYTLTAGPTSFAGDSFKECLYELVDYEDTEVFGDFDELLSQVTQSVCASKVIEEEIEQLEELEADGLPNDDPSNADRDEAVSELVYPQGSVSEDVLDLCATGNRFEIRWAGAELSQTATTELLSASVLRWMSDPQGQWVLDLIFGDINDAAAAGETQLVLGFASVDERWHLKRKRSPMLEAIDPTFMLQLIALKDFSCSIREIRRGEADLNISW